MSQQELLTKLFNTSTKLSPAEINSIVPIILRYEEVDELAYELIGLVNSGMSFETIRSDFLSENFQWKGSAYKDFRNARALEDAILSRPPEIREGELECPRCRSKKTVVVEMQTRSADEGFTYFIHCFEPTCKKVTKT